MDVADVEALLRLNIGDAGRLNHIKSKLESGSDLYKSDREYLERLKNRLAAVNAPPTPAPNDEKPDTLAQEPQADTSQNSTVVITTKAPQSSAAWYLMPVFLGVIGGLIAYFVMRGTDPRKAKRCLIIGLLLTVVPFVVWYGAYVYYYIEANVTEPDHYWNERLDELNGEFTAYNDIAAEHNRKYAELIPLTQRCVGIISELDAPELIHTIPDECKTIYAQGKEVLKIAKDKVPYGALFAEYQILRDNSIELDERYHYENNRFNELSGEKGNLQDEFFQALDEYDVLTEQYGCDVIAC